YFDFVEAVQPSVRTAHLTRADRRRLIQNGRRTTRCTRYGALLASLDDLALRQRLLEFLHARVGHLRAVETQSGEVLECHQFLQARVRHLGVVQVECGEGLELGQFLYPRVRDPVVTQ